MHDGCQIKCFTYKICRNQHIQTGGGLGLFGRKFIRQKSFILKINKITYLLNNK